MDIHNIVDHLGCINTRIADKMRNIGDDARSDPFIQRHLANRATGGIEMFLAIHVRTQVDAEALQIEPLRPMPKNCPPTRLV